MKHQYLQKAKEFQKALIEESERERASHYQALESQRKEIEFLRKQPNQNSDRDQILLWRKDLEKLHADHQKGLSELATMQSDNVRLREQMDC